MATIPLREGSQMKTGNFCCTPKHIPLARKEDFPSHWIRKKRGAVIYHGVRISHISLVRDAFEQALQKYEGATMIAATYAMSSTDETSCIVQCRFSRCKEIRIRRSSVNPFVLQFDAQTYEPTVQDRPCEGDTWSVVSGSRTDPGQWSRCQGLQQRVLEYLAKSEDSTIRTFALAVEGHTIAIGASPISDTRQPCIFNSTSCWRRPWSSAELLERLILGLPRSQAYRSDNQHRPAEEGEPFRAIALAQILSGRRREEALCFVLNVPMGDMGMQIPSGLRDGMDALLDPTLEVYSNMAPDGCVIDLHIGEYLQAPVRRRLLNGTQITV